MPSTSRPTVWRITVELLDVEPHIWRTFDTLCNVPLWHLHYFIQGAMGWEAHHLFEFVGDYGESLGENVRLCDACDVGGQLTYVYDLGDYWQHAVEIDFAVDPLPVAYPHLVDGENACPPEDIGGPAGFDDLLRHRRPGSRGRRLVDGRATTGFDPSCFDLEKARARLTRYAEATLRASDGRQAGS